MDQVLLLLHGLGMSAEVWTPLVPALARHHEVVAHTMLGHRGGVPASKRPVVLSDFVDDVQRVLDTAGIDRPHVAGNSLGGWVALELARAPAASVALLSPAGSGGPNAARATLGGAARHPRAHPHARSGR